MNTIRSSGIKPSRTSGSLDYTFGGFELNDIFRGDKKLNLVQKELAIEFLRRSEQIQLERLQCLADGALLGVEQVQDVRLDLLDQGPEVDTSAVIVDLFIGFLLDSSIPGRLLKVFANTTCKRLVARSAIFKVDGKLALEEADKEFKFFKEFVSSKAAYEEINASFNAAKYLNHAKGARKLIELASNSDVQKDVVATLKTIRNANSKKLTDKPKPLRTDGDTPGVSLLGSVNEFVAINRLLVQFQYRRMETFIRFNFMTGDEARRFVTLAEFDPLESPLKAIRDQCKLLFEAIIWAGLFQFNENSRGIVLKNDRPFSNEVIMEGIDPRLSNYWIRRFGGTVKQWSDQLPFPGQRELRKAIDDWETTNRVQQLGWIRAFFIRVLRDLPESLEEAGALTSTSLPVSIDSIKSQNK
jgi:hypothetical protein